MENIITNPGFFEIHQQIFGSLDYETLLLCLQVSKDWNASLKRLACVKFMQEFGKKIATKPGEMMEEESSVEAMCPGWNKTVEKYGLQASIKDLQDIKNSFAELLYYHHLNAQDDDDEDYEDFNVVNDGEDEDDEEQIHIPGLKYDEDLNWSSSHPNLSCPQIRAILRKYGKFETYFIWTVVDSNNPSLFKFVADSGYDLEHLNESDQYRPKVTAFLYACHNGRTNIVRFMIEHSKEYNINLDYSNLMGHTPFYRACGRMGNSETVKLFFESAKKYNIGLNHRDNWGLTPFLHLIREAKKDFKKSFKLFIENYEEHGIDINAQDNKGATAFDHAEHSIEHLYGLEECYGESKYEEIDAVEECMEMLREELINKEKRDNDLKKVMTLKEKGNKAFGQRKYQEAIDLYTSAIRINDTNPVFYTNRAQAFLKLGKAMDASQDCRKALELKPDFVKAFIHLAKALKELGEVQEAIETLERAEGLCNDEQATVVKMYKVQLVEEQTKNLSFVEDQRTSK